MKRTRRSRLTAVLAALATGTALALASVTPQAQAQAPVGGDIVANGGFEGNLWQANESGSATVVTDQAHAGTRSIKASGRTTTGSGPMQRLGGRMSAGTTYSLSYWIYYDGETAPATKNFWATARYASAQKNEYGPYNLHVNLVAANNVPKGTWTQATGTFTIPADREDVSVFNLFFETPWTASPTAANDLFDFYVDDVVLTVQGQTRNLVAGGDFENVDVAPWTPRGGSTTITRDTTQAASGTGSLLVANRGAAHHAVAQSLPVEAGATYDVSFKVRYTDPAAPDTLRFQGTVDYGSATGGAQYVIVLGGDATKGQWSTISGEMVVPEGRDLGMFQFYVENVYGTASFPSFHLDDVSIVKTSGGSGEPDPETPADPLESHNTEAGSFGAYAKTVGRGNPLVTQNFGADPWAMEYDGRLYVYTTNDTQEWPEYLARGEDNNYGSINQINVWSSADLVNWTNHGSINAAGPSGLAPGANNSWAPAAAHKTIDGEERFFLYFANSAGGIWVLEGDSPVGPWTSPRTDALVGWTTPGVRNLEGATDVVWLFDPAVLVDDDGQAYLYFGGGVPNGQADDPETARVIRLGDDMVSTVGSAELVDAPGIFEDSGIHKFNGKYYYSYCTNFSTNLPIGRGNIAYMEADSPMGPWTESTFQGLAFQNQNAFFGVGGNNHHAIFQFKGEWYLIYHAQTLDKALTGGNGFRNAHIDKIEIAEDGSITPVTGTYEGIAQLQALDPYAGPIQAETIAWQSGTRQGYVGGSSFANEVPTVELTSIHDADWTSLSDADFGAGADTVSARVQGRAGGTISVRTSPDQTDASNVVATLDVPAGDGNTWSTVSAEVAEGALAGVRDVYFTFDGEGEDPLFDVLTWSFTEVEDTAEPAPTSVSAAPVSVAYGQAASLAVTVSGADAGTVTTVVGGRTVSAPVDASGRAVLPLAAGALAPGTHTLTVSYTGTAAHAPSSTTAQVTVTKAAASVSTAGPKKVRAGKTLTVRVRVTASGATPTGQVTVRLAGVRKAVTATVQGGAVTVKLRVPSRVQPGSKRLTVTYAGSELVAGAQAVRVVRVTR